MNSAAFHASCGVRQASLSPGRGEEGGDDSGGMDLP
jgi:hypothetical protein